MPEPVAGSDWSEAEVATCVDSYFEHLKLELMGGSFNKSQLYRDLSERTGRSPKSFERKFQNISAVLDEIGREWITGLPPLRQFQELLATKVAEHIGMLDRLPLSSPSIASDGGFSEAAVLFLEAPPERQAVRKDLPEYMVRLAKFFDPVERDIRNKALGDAGEEMVYEHERRSLLDIGRADLAANVRWISREEGDGAGFDILSFSDRGEKKFVEVKTTVGSERTPFFVSRNEHEFCRKNAEHYSLMRLYDFRKQVRAFELRGRLDSHVNLSTEIFRAEF
jgi:hypothetical protein